MVPVAKLQVGCVIVPTGTEGVANGESIVTINGVFTHPDEFLIVNS